MGRIMVVCALVVMAFGGCSLYTGDDEGEGEPDAMVVVGADAGLPDAGEPDAYSCGHEGEQCCVTPAGPPSCLDDLVCGLPVANVCSAE